MELGPTVDQGSSVPVLGELRIHKVNLKYKCQGQDVFLSNLLTSSKLPLLFLSVAMAGVTMRTAGGGAGERPSAMQLPRRRATAEVPAGPSPACSSLPAPRTSP